MVSPVNGQWSMAWLIFISFLLSSTLDICTPLPQIPPGFKFSPCQDLWGVPHGRLRGQGRAAKGLQLSQQGLALCLQELCGSRVSGAAGLWRISGRNSCLQ